MDVVTGPNPWELTNNFRGLSGCLTADSANRDRRFAGMRWLVPTASNGVWPGAGPSQTRSSIRLTVWSGLRPRRWASDRNRDAVSQRRAIFVRC